MSVWLVIGKLLLAGLLFRDYKDVAKRWAGYFILFGIGYEVLEFVLWWQRQLQVEGAGFRLLGHLYDALHLFVETGIVYVLIPCGLVFHSWSWFVGKRKVVILAMLTIPALALMIEALLRDSSILNEGVRFVYALLSTVIAIGLMVWATVVERNRKMKRMMLVGTVILSANFIALLMARHVDRFAWDDLLQAVTIAAVLIMAFRSRVLGFRLRFEREVFEQSYKAVTSGTAMMNHAIKNKLQLIDMLASRIETASDSSKQTVKDARLIQEEMNQLMDMIGRIQHRIREIHLVEEPVSIGELLRAAMDANRPLAEKKGIAMELTVASDVLVWGDRVHLMEAIGNVLHNALDAVVQGKGKVEVTAAATRGGVEIDIRDNGAGIPHELQSRIFEPFFSSKGRSDSFGLGLAYVFAVMEKHGGSVAVKSEPGDGAAFTLRFPARRIVRGAAASFDEPYRKERRSDAESTSVHSRADLRG